MTVPVVPEGYVPETEYHRVVDELRETEKRLGMWQMVAATHKDKNLLLERQNADLSRTLRRMRKRGIVDTSADGFDEARYRKVCRLLEEAQQIMAEWGCDVPQKTISFKCDVTVGENTCKNISDPPEGFLCSECGWGDFDEPTHLLKDAKFCPNCGARIEVGE